MRAAETRTMARSARTQPEEADFLQVAERPHRRAAYQRDELAPSDFVAPETSAPWGGGIPQRLSETCFLSTGRRRSNSRAVRNGIAARLGPRPPVVLYPSYRGKIATIWSMQPTR